MQDKPITHNTENTPDTLDLFSVVHKHQQTRNFLLTILVVFSLIFFLHWARDILIPLVISILISYALDPIVCAMEKWRIPRVIGAALLLLLLVSGAMYLTYQLRDEAFNLIDQLPNAVQKINRTLNKYRGDQQTTLKKVQQATTELEKAATQIAGSSTPPGVTRVQIERSFSEKLGEYLWSGSKGLMEFLSIAILCLFLIYYLLIAGDLFKRKLIKIVGPSLTKKKITVQIFEEINRQIKRFLMVQLLTGVIVGIATWLAFTAIGFEQAAIWGLAAGILNSVPYLGPVIISGGTALTAFLQFGTLGMTIVVSGTALIITSLEGYLLTPWLTSRAGKMNAAAVFLGLLFWGWIWGVWGLLLGIPILMVIKAMCEKIEDFNPVSELLGK